VECTGHTSALPLLPNCCRSKEISIKCLECGFWQAVLITRCVYRKSNESSYLQTLELKSSCVYSKSDNAILYRMRMKTGEAKYMFHMQIFRLHALIGTVCHLLYSLVDGLLKCWDLILPFKSFRN